MGTLEQVAPPKKDLAAGDPAGGLWDEAQERQRRHRLARSRLPNNTQHLIGKDVEAHAEDGVRGAPIDGELRVEVPNLKEGAQRNLENVRGSNASRIASPMKTTSRRVRNKAPSGNTTRCQSSLVT